MYRPSPSGAWFLCDRFPNLLLVEGAAPHRVHVVVSSFLENAGQTSFGWLDDERFLATVDDAACPRANLYDYFPTRVVLFSRTKGRLANGPCAFGVVVGRRRIALLGEAPNSLIRDVMIALSDDSRFCCDGYDKYHHTWSLDLGRTWHDGYPLGFDQADRLQYGDAFSDRVLTE